MSDSDKEIISRTLKWLEDEKDILGSTTMMPLINHDMKQPKFSHMNGAWTPSLLQTFMETHPAYTAYGLLLDNLCVVDADTADAVSSFERLAEEDPEVRDALDVCPIQITKKGRHYFFLRPEWASPEGFFDGARQSPLIPDLDMKSLCSTGTRGLLVVSPSHGKSWFPGRAPWSDGVSLVDIPRTLMNAVAKGKPPLPPHPPRRSRPTQPPHPPPQACPAISALTLDRANVELATSLVAILSAARMDAYPSWIELGWCLHNIDPGFLYLWIEASQKSSKFKCGECEKLWATMRSEGIGMGSLRMWARSDDPSEYKNILNASVDIKSSDGSHNSIAMFASKLLEGRHVCASTSGKLWYYFDGTLWKVDQDAIRVKRELSSTVVSHVMMAINGVMMSSMSLDDLQSETSSTKEPSETKKLSERLMKIAFKLKDRYFKESVVLEMREYMLDLMFEQKLDGDRNLIAFTDGVWQLDTGTFRLALPEDRLRHSTGYPFMQGPDAEQAEKDAMVARYWETMHPDEDQRSYVKKTFARQLFGDHGKELFHIHTGYIASACNGKSRFFEIMASVLGSYVRKFGVEMLTTKDRIEPGKPMPEYKYWQGVRILYCTEPNANEKLNTGILKDLTGGEVIMYRALHSNEIIQFKPQHKAHLMCNDCPIIDGQDSGMQRRLVKVDYISRFVDPSQANEAEHKYPRDDVLIQAFQDDISLKLAFFKDLVSEFDMEYIFEMPESIRANSRMYLEENDTVLQFTTECVVPSVGSCFLLKEAKALYKAQSYASGSIATLKNDLQKTLGTRCFPQKRVPSRGSYNMTNVFMDFRLRDHDEVDPLFVETE